MARRFVASTAVFLLLGLVPPRPAHAVLHAGDVAPNFTKTDLSGTVRSLYDYRGKVVVMFLLGYN